jgi:tetratricopeptide (TPR) repeat protein
VVVLAAVLALGARDAGAQGGLPPLVRALDLEQRGRTREAIVAFREALAGRDMIAALLGLERAYADLGRSDSLVTLADSLARAHPRETLVQTVRLRTLLYARRVGAASMAFREWTRAMPNQLVPYREYSRLLLDASQFAAVDSVLDAAASIPGGRVGLAAERARLEASRGAWGAATASWRVAIEAASFQLPAATYSLGEADEAHRDAIRTALAAPPLSRPARELASALELQWGAPAAAWGAISALPADSGSAAIWRSFADRAAAVEAWLPARDAWRATLRVACEEELLLRAADASIRGGDAVGALALLSDESCRPQRTARRRVAAALRVRALAQSGRPADAARALDSLSLGDDPDLRRTLETAVAWGWVRVGDIARAREQMGEALDADTSGVRGWLALYEGDLATARTALRESGTPSRDAVMVLSTLARTRASRSELLGSGYLALARGDTLAAAAALERAAGELPDAAPALLLRVAELHAARGDIARAEPLWRSIVERHEQSPDAPAAELAWARALIRRGDRGGARARLEHLILTYPTSALVPQARRALDALGGV